MDPIVPATNQVNLLRNDSLLSSVPTLGGRTVCWINEAIIIEYLKDSSYRPSIRSQPTDDTEDELSEEETEDSVQSDHFIIAKAQLDILFRRCQQCGGLIDQTRKCWRQSASAIYVIYKCMECLKEFRWDSQSKRGTGKSRVYEMNQNIPVAAYATGSPIPVTYPLITLKWSLTCFAETDSFLWWTQSWYSKRALNAQYYPLLCMPSNR